MPDIVETVPQDPDLAAVLSDIMPTLRGEQRTGWGLIGLTAVVTAGAILALFGNIENSLAAVLFPLGIGAMAIWFISDRVRKRHEAALMPTLARAVGFSYAQNGSDFVKALPTRLLPKAAVRYGEDHLTGTIGGRAVALAEAKVESGGKNSRTLFKGFVVTFANLVPMPAFFIAAEKQTRGVFIFKGRIPVDDLEQVRTVQGRANETYGVWASTTKTDPALDAVVNVLTGLQDNVSSDAQLFSATSTGREMHIALSHGRDLFRIGGLLATEAAIMSAVQAAFEDLSIPMKVVAALLEAESRVLKDREPSPEPAGSAPRSA